MHGQETNIAQLYTFLVDINDTVTSFINLFKVKMKKLLTHLIFLNITTSSDLSWDIFILIYFPRNIYSDQPFPSIKYA